MAAKPDEKLNLGFVEGYTISLDHNKRFIAYGKDVPLDMALYADTFAKLKEIVNEHVLKLAASIRKQLKVSLPVVTDRGHKVVVTGIHPRQRTLNGTKDKVKDVVFPDVPWIVGLIEERARLAERIVEITKTIRPYAIDNKIDGWGEMSSAVYEGSTNQLKTDYEKSLIAAQKVEQEKAGAKT